MKALKVSADTNANEDLDLLSEADLSKHLSNPTLKAAKEADEALKEEEAKNKPAEPTKDKTTGSTTDKETSQPQTDASKADQDKPLAETDYQLFEALNILKGIDLATKRNKDATPPLRRFNE